MKKNNDLDHFLYEILREKSLKNFVSKYLNSYQPFKDWIEPFLETNSIRIYPDRRIRWKGYYVQMGKRGPMELMLHFSKNGKINGHGIDANGAFSVKGVHTDFSEVKFTKKMEIRNGWSIEYEGKFVDVSTIEGKFNVMGSVGEFRIWISDNICPGLSFSFSDTSFRRKKKLPHTELEWEGYYIQNLVKESMKIKMTVGNDGKIIGNGVEKFGPFSIIGQHENYSSISFIKKMQTANPESVYFDGEFVDEKTIEGKYSGTKNLGNFKIWLKEILNLPFEDQLLRWDGYFIQGGHKGGMQIQLRISPTGEASGFGYDQYGPFTLKGNHNQYKNITWTKTMDIPNGWTIKYSGIISPVGEIEGIYDVGGSKGHFKFWRV